MQRFMSSNTKECILGISSTRIKKNVKTMNIIIVLKKLINSALVIFTIV